MRRPSLALEIRQGKILPLAEHRAPIAAPVFQVSDRLRLNQTQIQPQILVPEVRLARRAQIDRQASQLKDSVVRTLVRQ